MPETGDWVRLAPGLRGMPAVTGAGSDPVTQPGRAQAGRGLAAGAIPPDDPRVNSRQVGPVGVAATGYYIQRHTDLVTCSLCLRVRCGSAWTEAEAVTRELRVLRAPTVPRLQPTVCGDCAAAIFDRRARAEEVTAA